ncbi:xanthine dehydrogenase family protein subunit M [Mesorhizobium sp. RMAD-H1]|uniref:FAD binding domain-containing protein n=1 Tax=Mesorhizobium sp. RMAD-H1 TaxID=2587065 RepID=UPI00161E6921|nr:xanthine dehydrogenase family protein subunit M [Mesorhizobium sp. RMAD-H1]MBB2972645.1 xanthine dehydrogenase YagS FAD-binding subunit [Mesorhizobium sp. RMAD-H1]
MKPFSYTRARTEEEVIASLSSPGTRILAGGTTLYDLMKLDVETPTHLVDIASLQGLDDILLGPERIELGALARMSDVAGHPGLAARYPVLAEALAKAASQQLRNMATLGGNLLQRTRCAYFRNGLHYPCNKRSPGSGCAAREGLDRNHALLGGSEACIAVYPGDFAVALVALDAEIETLGPGGRRRHKVAELHRLPGSTPHVETILEPEEMIVRIMVPAAPYGRASTYHKIRDRESYAFALTSAAVALDIEGGVIRSARIALGGVATRPWRVPDAEAMLAGQKFDERLAMEAGRMAMRGAQPGRHNGFKLELGARTVAEAIRIASDRGARL